MKPQVEASYYNFKDYVHKEQFLSYYNQLILIHKIKPKSILEIGVGGKIIEKLIPINIQYTSCDISKDLYPGLVANIENLPFKKNTFDLVVCFEVLEHLPFEKFPSNLKEISRVSKKDVLISLPYANNKFSASIFLPLIHELNLTFLMPKFYRKHKFDGLHYWEIGKRNFSMNRIKNVIKNEFKIVNSFTSLDNTYHTYFLLQKKQLVNE